MDYSKLYSRKRAMTITKTLPLLLLLACGKVPVYVDPEFKPYLDKFSTDLSAATCPTMLRQEIENIVIYVVISIN